MAKERDSTKGEDGSEPGAEASDLRVTFMGNTVHPNQRFGDHCRDDNGQPVDRSPEDCNRGIASRIYFAAPGAELRFRMARDGRLETMNMFVDPIREVTWGEVLGILEKKGVGGKYTKVLFGDPEGSVSGFKKKKLNFGDPGAPVDPLKGLQDMIVAEERDYFRGLNLSKSEEVAKFCSTVFRNTAKGLYLRYRDWHLQHNEAKERERGPSLYLGATVDRGMSDVSILINSELVPKLLDLVCGYLQNREPSNICDAIAVAVDEFLDTLDIVWSRPEYPYAPNKACFVVDMAHDLGNMLMSTQRESRDDSTSPIRYCPDLQVGLSSMD